ncbi:hypothetical protein IVB15_20040 [Bradyrhizobium sp. 182]|uniref:hypothetical protein n=1 Tax=Bradyrhizobium sp. 182 TaxID=2782651 RepID=UPI001FFBF3D3|nr:hypothetical protein [Bradyrhizobium sp. 182]MCK1529948.1 hypothetical protein [Bradyrhizobium sp. 182]
MTAVVNPFRVSRILEVQDLAAAQKGIRVLLGFDFHQYVSITRLTPTKGSTFPNFRPDRSPIKPSEGYWIVGVDKNNEVALLNAVRLYDLSNSNLAEHLQSLKAFYADPARHAHPQDKCICTAPSARKITGNVAYDGDLWLRRDFRGQGLVKIVTAIKRRVTFAMWAPDFICALVERWTLDKAVYDVAQVAHSEPGGAMLHLIEEKISEDNWLIWRTGEELRSDLECQEESQPPITVQSFMAARR